MIEIYAKITYISYWFWYSVLLNIVHNFTSFHVTDGTFVINNIFFKKNVLFSNYFISVLIVNRPPKRNS